MEIRAGGGFSALEGGGLAVSEIRAPVGEGGGGWQKILPSVGVCGFFLE